MALAWHCTVCRNSLDHRGSLQSKSTEVKGELSQTDDMQAYCLLYEPSLLHGTSWLLSAFTWPEASEDRLSLRCNLQHVYAFCTPFLCVKNIIKRVFEWICWFSEENLTSWLCKLLTLNMASHYYRTIKLRFSSAPYILTPCYNKLMTKLNESYLRLILSVFHSWACTVFWRKKIYYQHFMFAKFCLVSHPVVISNDKFKFHNWTAAYAVPVQIPQ